MAKSSKRLKHYIIDDQSRIALPAEVLRALGAKKRDYVTFQIDSGGVRILKVDWEPG